MPFIALRAAITYKTVKDNESDKLKAMDAVIDDFKLIIRAAQASIDSMNEFRPKLLAATSRDASSAVMYKNVKPAEEVIPTVVSEKTLKV